MSYRLVGPFDFDLDAQVASAREALGTVAQAVRAGDDKPLASVLPKKSGLYLLLEGPEDAQPKQLRILGFWVSLGNSWMAKGPAGPPDREAPVAKALLDAATEEVWWENLPVASKRKGSWTPLIVLEWPSAVAFRAEVPPPGVPEFGKDDGGDDQGEPEAWLPQGAQAAAKKAAPKAGARDEAQDRIARYYAHLPEDRSLLTVIRGHFKKTRALHTGTFEVLHPDVFGEGKDALPFEEWVPLALEGKNKSNKTAEEEEAAPGFGRPLALFAGAVGFPLRSWLTRNLGPWPLMFADIRPGRLTDREVQVRWIQQARMAMSSTVFVLVLVVGFTLGIRTAAQPRPRPVEAEPPPAAQPAMSVCSADNQKFVEEFRCQIAHLAAGSNGALVERVCGDDGAEASTMIVPTGNLQVEYCGLRDRKADEWFAKFGPPTDENGPLFSWAAVAGAQACFNVLGHPHPYEHPLSESRKLGNPTAFLDDEQLAIQQLVDLTRELDAACETYQVRLESRMEGAVFATHIGAKGSDDTTSSEAEKLRETAVETALVGTSSDSRKCFEIGMDKSLDMSGYEAMCLPERRRNADNKPTDRRDQEIFATKIWQALDGPAGETNVSLIDRYVRARFGPLDPTKASGLPSLWQCHLGLDGQARRPSETTLGAWEIPIPVPARYRTSGAGAYSQLQLDATLIKLREGTKVDECWDVVSKKLASYAPVHPLLEPLAEDGWPSAEQQLCGQICAAAYKVRKHEGVTPWVTPAADLATCVTGEPLPRDERADPGRGRLDRLRMPWNYAGQRGWIDPSESHICAFNLIAQNKIPAAESFIVSGYSAQQWAGEMPGSTRISGYKEGLVVQAVVGMSRFGTGSAWSLSSCGHVSLQCFTGVMLDVLGDEDLERYDWLGEWRKRILLLSDSPGAQVAESQPWCAPLQDYLSADEMGAQFDAPCRAGVEEARAHVEYAIRTLAAERD